MHIPLGGVAEKKEFFELFEDRELVAAQDFVAIVRTAIAAEAKGIREQVQKGEQILERIAARLNCS